MVARTASRHSSFLVGGLAVLLGALTITPGARALAATQGSPSPAPTLDRPTLSLDQFVSVRRARLKEITDAQIAKMRALVAATGADDPQKPDLYFRLGELAADNHRYASDRARALDQRIFEAPADAKPALAREQQGLEKQAEAWLLEAVKAYIAASRSRRYERMDEVLFRLAYLLTEVKKEDQAREFLLRLIKDHPTSRFIPDAYLAFAELYFERGEIESAQRFYEKVEQFPAARVFPYAVYKKAWCQVNLGDFMSALETFVRITRMPGEPVGGARVSGPRKDLDALVKETRKDIVAAYARVGGPDRASDFFRRVGGDSAGKMMEALAERYWEQGQAADSTRTYRKIIADNPTSQRLCDWQGKVLRNTMSAGDKASQLQELQRLGAVFDGARRDRARDDSCRARFHDATRETALTWHREAQRTRNTETSRLAESAYRLFLDHFPDDRDSYEMTYYSGELLWSLGRWKDAAQQYGRVVEMNPGGKYLRDAARAAVLAWKNALAETDDQRRDAAGRERDAARNRKDPDRPAPQSIPDDARKLIAALQAYRKYVPDGPEMPAIIYREAYINYDYNHFDRAEPLFRQVFETYPEHELASIAADLFLDTLNGQGKTDELAARVRAFLDTPALLKDADFARRMLRLQSDVFEREARASEARGDFKEAARSFLAAADAVPTHAKHAERLWNAAQCFQNAHLMGQAVKTWRALIEAHRGEPIASRALFRVGAGYHQLAYYGEAADAYEEFAKKFPGEPRASVALGNATMFREGLGNGTQAIADMEAFVGFYGARKPQDAAAVHFQMSEVYQAEGHADDLAAHLREYLAKWAPHGGLDREVEAHFRLGELAWRQSCPRPGPDGLCVSIERVTSTRGGQILSAARRRLGKEKRTQCGPPTKSRIVTLPRDRARVAAAVDHLRRALALWNGGEPANPIAGRDRDARRALAAHAAAGAAFYLAESSYEDLLRLRFPRGLDFTRPSSADGPRRQAAVRRKLEDSNRRFTDYLNEKAALLDKSRSLYLDVFNRRQAHWTIAAAARIGQLHQDFASQLYTAEIPGDLPEVDVWGNRPRDLYCDELEDRAGKIEAQAVDGFTSCLAAATRQSWFNEWSRLCERELNQMEPARFPLAAELKPEPIYAPTDIAAAPLRRELN